MSYREYGNALEAYNEKLARNKVFDLVGKPCTRCGKRLSYADLKAVGTARICRGCHTGPLYQAKFQTKRVSFEGQVTYACAYCGWRLFEAELKANREANRPQEFYACKKHQPTKTKRLQAIKAAAQRNKGSK